MRSDEILVEALKITDLPIKYQEYEGTKPVYIVYNEEAEQPTNYGDNVPQNEIAWWQVHIFSPKDNDFRMIKNKTKHALQEAGFTVTDIVTLYEKETKTIHVAISCHTGESEE